MKRWGSFLLVMITIQLYAQDKSDKVQAVPIMEGVASAVAKESEDVSQTVNQEQEAAIESAPASGLLEETPLEGVQGSISQSVVKKDDRSLAKYSEAEVQEADIGAPDTIQSSLSEPAEDVSSGQIETIEVVDQESVESPDTGKPIVEQPVGGQATTEESTTEESVAGEPLEGQVGIDAPPVDQASVAISLPSGWEQAQKPGNYQKKAQIFKQAGDVYSKIRAVKPSLLQARESFLSQKATLNTNIMKFFYEVGATQAEITQQIDDLIQEFDEEESGDNELLEEERELVLELNQNKSDLNVLKQNITSLTDVSASLDNGLAQLDSLFSKAQDYEGSGWQIYQQIDEIFDDVQAADLLSQMQVIQENAEAFITYAQGPFAQFFSSSISMINTQMAQIKSTLTALQDRGVAIAKEEEQFDADEEARQEAQAQASAQEAAASKEQEAATWQSKIQKYFSTTWQWIKGTALLVYDKLFGPSAVPEPESESVNQAESANGQTNAQGVSLEPVTTPQKEAVQPEEEAPNASRAILPSSIQAQPLPEPPVENVATDTQ